MTDHGLRIDGSSRDTMMTLDARGVEEDTAELDWGLPEEQVTRRASLEVGERAKHGERIAELQASIQRSQEEGDVHMAMVLTRKLKVAVAKCEGDAKA